MELPELEPSFDGNLMEWEYFRDLFISVIHENKTLSQFDKLLYLRSALKGEAFNYCQHSLDRRLRDCVATYIDAFQQLAAIVYAAHNYNV